MTIDKGNLLHRKPRARSLASCMKELRLRAGYSQQNIADLLNVNRSTYTYYEMGKTSPDPTTLYRIAKILGVPIDYFFEDDESPLVLCDTESFPSRSPKKVAMDPQRIGELSAGERKIVGFLRDKELDPEEILAILRDRFEGNDN